MAVNFATLGQGAVRTTVLSGLQPISICGMFYIPNTIPATLLTTLFYRGDDPVALYTEYVWIGINSDGTLMLSTSGAADVTSAPTVMAPGWHTWAYSYNHVSGVHTLYWDGNLPGVSVTDSTAAWTVTHEYLGTDEFLPDDWDENTQLRVKQWNEILLASEMWATTNYETNPGVRVANIYGDWPLTSDLLDVSGLGHDWTAVGGPLTFVDGPSGSNRWYPLVRAPRLRIDEPVKGTWAQNHSFSSAPWSKVQWTWMAGPTPYIGGVAQVLGPISTFNCNETSDYDWHFMRWMLGPLEAMDLDTAFNLCVYGRAAFEDAGQHATSDVRFKLHIYITNGESADVREVVLDNYVDATSFFPSTGLQAWQALTAVQQLVGTIEDGDCLMIEFGWAIISSPPTLPATYPPTQYTNVRFRNGGANPANIDAIVSGTTAAQNPWFQFSQFLTPKAGSAPPANDACVDAIAITLDTDTRWESGAIDTSGSLGTGRDVFFTWTAPADGRVFFTSYASTYAVAIAAYTNGCTQTTLPPDSVQYDQALGTQRSQGVFTFVAVASQAYLIRARSSTTINTSAINGGGLLYLQGFYQQTLAVDDVVSPITTVNIYRAGLPISISVVTASLIPTGVAFDYTHRPLVPIGAGVNPNVSDRMLIGSFGFDLIEIFDPYVFGSGDEELDYILDPLAGAERPGQNYVTAAGDLTQGFFGNGFLYVAAVAPSLAAFLNAPSDAPTVSALHTLSAIDGDNQPGAPFSAQTDAPLVEVTAPWCLSIDEANNIVYYTSGNLYDNAGTAQQIRRYNLSTMSDLGVWATLPTRTLLTAAAPGVRGLEFIGSDQVLVCNSDCVQLVSAGVVVRTYTPSIPLESQTLIDVKLTADGTAFWVQDLWTTRLYQFDVASGAELFTTATYQVPAAQTSLAIFQPEGFVPPPPECPGILGSPLIGA